MASLPTYEESISGPDWLTLVAPYVSFSDYFHLCLVNRRFRAIFAPLMWSDLLKTARRIGLDPSWDLEWWYWMVFTKLSAVRHETRSLVRTLDLRDFAKETCDFASDETEKTVQQSFRQALALLPRVESVLLDGQADVDLSTVAGDPPSNKQVTYVSKNSPLVLSLCGTSSKLPSALNNAPVMRGLIYLDISGVPGPLTTWVQPGRLPDLRILKIRSKEIDNAAFGSLINLFKLRLCSLDVSGNRLTDDIIEPLGECCIPDIELRSDAAYRVEGKLVVDDYGTESYGRFISVEESQLSGTFSHSERFFIDAPMYIPNINEAPSEVQAPRAYGREPVWEDSAEAVTTKLPEYGFAFEHFVPIRGLTHLHLSHNQVSAAGIEKLIRTSNGQIENLSCDSMPLLPPSAKSLRLWPKSVWLRGIVGGAHIFRPVFSSNLRTLRVHHSLVTQIPTLDSENLSALARIYLSEIAILPRVEKAYTAQGYVPDMNPRLTSLTLTCIPRRSSGPLIDKLTDFLRLLSQQERAIADVGSAGPSLRGPGLLKGLRHLRLEFESDPTEEDFSASGDFDAEGLLNSGEQGFSFFADERTQRREPGKKSKSDLRSPANSCGSGGEGTCAGESVRDDETFVTYHGEWNGEAFSIPVWIGNKASHADNPVLGDYRKLVVSSASNVRDGVGPATPAQIRAGAPEKSYVFHTAWTLAIMPRELKPPAEMELAGMKDVVAALKAYRLSTRSTYLNMLRRDGHRKSRLGEPHYFWTGNLEVSRAEARH